MPITVEVLRTQVLDPDEAFRFIVIINFGDPDSVDVEKFRNLDVMPIFVALQIVLNQDQRLARRATNPIKFSIGPAFFDWANFYIGYVQQRKMHPCSAEKKFGPQGARSRRPGNFLQQPSSRAAVRSDQRWLTLRCAQATPVF